MSGAELSLIAVVVAFSGLVGWVYWPGNRKRLESYGSMPLIEEPQDGPADPDGDRGAVAQPGARR